MSHILYGLVIGLHVLVGLFLIVVVLLQGGRGGMGEALAGGAAQSLFGGAVNTVMTKITAIVAGLFMVTCLALAALSTSQGRSVIEQMPATLPDALPPGLVPPLAPEQVVPSPQVESAAPETPSATPTPTPDAPASP